jgi:hypothetical protein
MHIPLDAAVPQIPFDFRDVLILFGNSILLGLALTWVTYLVVCQAESDDEDEEGPLSPKDKYKLFLGASNILFMCVGLTGVMLLVGNNLARAFAIGAALALSRFRVKISKKSTGTHLMFGIISGIACGLDQLAIAWTCSIIYVVLQLALFLVFQKKQKNPVT